MPVSSYDKSLYNTQIYGIDLTFATTFVLTKALRNMKSAIYEGLELRIYSSHMEYETVNDAKFAWCDAEGNDLELKTEDIDLSRAESKEHFSDDSTFKPETLCWHAEIDPVMPKGIACIVAELPEKLTFEKILLTVGHELGHIVDANEYQNSDADYETQEGYQQEETKALAFEKFVLDSYRMALLFRTMFMELGVQVTGIA